MKGVAEGIQPKVLLNMMNENGKISRSHAISKNLLQQQADLIGLPLVTQPTTWGDYELLFVQQLVYLKDEYQLNSAIFGDIDLQPHRNWEEKVCQQAHLKARLPLWQRNRKELVLEMLDNNLEAIITSCNLQLGVDFLGRKLNHELIDEFEQIGIDVCGENGEYHTLVVNCPLFKKELELPVYQKKIVGEYCFLVWEEN